MSPQSFQRQIERLREQWPHAYPQGRVAIMWKAMSKLSDEWFETQVDHFIGSERNAPLMPDFQASIYREQEREHERTKHQRQELRAQSGCEFCKGLGTYLCTKNGEDGKWAFRCHCSAGESDPRTMIPQFKQGHQAEGFRFYEVGQ